MLKGNHKPPLRASWGITWLSPSTPACRTLARLVPPAVGGPFSCQPVLPEPWTLPQLNSFLQTLALYWYKWFIHFINYQLLATGSISDLWSETMGCSKKRKTRTESASPAILLFFNATVSGHTLDLLLKKLMTVRLTALIHNTFFAPHRVKS